MFAQRSAGVQALLACCQLVMAEALFWALALLLVFVHLPDGTSFWTAYTGCAAMVLFGLLIQAFSRGTLHRAGYHSQGLAAAHHSSLRQTLFVIALLFGYIVAGKDRTISRLFLAAYLPALYLLLLLSNYSLPRLLARGLFNGNRREKTLLIGRVFEAEILRPWLEHKAMLGLTTVGMVSDDPEEEFAHGGFPRLGASEALAEVIRQHHITQVIRTALPDSLSEHHAVIDTCEKLGVRLLVVSNLQEHWGRPLTFIEDESFRFIGMREEPLENPLNRLLKRGIDVAISLVGVVFILPPAALLVWLAQRLQSPGPLFYRQSRAGLQNREFQILKFRTMHVAAPAPERKGDSNNGHYHFRRPDEASQATRFDERIFPIGKLMRKFSIDELPQLWNVFRGDMSLVGPRPHLVEHNNLFAQCLASYHVRTFVKPGLTGLAQVRGFRGEMSSNLDIVRRVAADIEYLEKWRFSLDCSILLRTIRDVINPPKSAY